MDNLPIQLQILNNFIFEKPQVVVRILKENNYSVSSSPTLNEITRLTIKGLVEDNQKFVDDLNAAIKTNDEAGVDPFTIATIALSIGSAIFGSKQAKKQREAMYNLKLMELANADKLASANITAMKDIQRQKILSDTVLAWSQSLQTESTARQRDTALFIGIMGVGLAVIYATIQIFKK